MSLCQPNSPFSCGACCGLFNLYVDVSTFKEILTERSDAFKREVNFNKKWTIAEFRKKREAEESWYPKKDDQTYNCPFLGYIDQSHFKIGCMIHPAFTGDPLSQNFSFYGASICQGYNCKNKEREDSEVWEKILSNMNLDSVSYSHLAGDHIFLSYLIDYAVELGFHLYELWEKEPQHLLEIIFKRLIVGFGNITSFEIDMEPATGNSAKEKLEIRFGIKI